MDTEKRLRELFQPLIFQRFCVSVEDGHTLGEPEIAMCAGEVSKSCLQSGSGHKNQYILFENV